MSVATLETGADIWARTVKPEQGDLASDTARFFLSLELASTETRRLGELSAKSRAGSMSAEETRELDRYLDMGWFLDFMKSKARRSLK